MKTLTTHILEHFNIRIDNHDNHANVINESFKSTIMQNIFSSTPKVSWKFIFSEPVSNKWLPASWNLIQDEDLLETATDDAYKLSRKKSNQYILWVTSNNELLGISKGTTIYSDYTQSKIWYSDKKINFYKTTKSISGVASKAYLLNVDKYSTTDLTSGRWRSQKDAIAMELNTKILRDNKARRDKILRDNNLIKYVQEFFPKLSDCGKLVEDVQNDFEKVLKDSEITQDWDSAENCRKCIFNATNALNDLLLGVIYIKKRREESEGNFSLYDDKVSKPYDEIKSQTKLAYSFIEKLKEFNDAD